MVNEDRTAPIIVEQEFDVVPTVLWSAISEQEQMIKWYFENIPDFKAEKGFETEFNIKSENRDFIHHWKVTEVVDQQKLVYEWTFHEIQGKSSSIFELFENEGGTLLRLTCDGLNTFPDDIPEFTRESAIGGWKYFIKNRLKEYIDQKS